MASAEPEKKTTEDSSEDEMTLPECFDRIFKLHQGLETTNEPTNSDSNQSRLRNGIILCEKAIGMVNALQLFSQNEDIDEVSSGEIKYMLLSAFLAFLTVLNTHIPRITAVTKSKLCYLDYLRLLKNYSVVDFEVKHPEDKEEEDEEDKPARAEPVRHQDVAAMCVQRNNKIQRFKEKKTLEKKLADLKVYVDQEHVDDEVKRDYYLTLLKHWANRAVDEIDSCDLELQMLKHREELEGRGRLGLLNIEEPQASKPKKSLRPFILTRTKLQKQVFGLGYPAIPTMTIDEFYEQKVKEGTLSESVQGHSLQEWARNPDKDAEDREREEADKERKMELEDPEALARARAMDDWKDDHRRGEGNRYNKG